MFPKQNIAAFCNKTLQNASDLGPDQPQDTFLQKFLNITKF